MKRILLTFIAFFAIYTISDAATTVPDSSMTFTGAHIVTGATTLSGATTISGTTTLSGATTISGAVTQSGATTHTSTVTVTTSATNALTVEAGDGTNALVIDTSGTTAFTITPNTTIGGTLGVTGATTHTGAVATNNTTTITTSNTNAFIVQAGDGTDAINIDTSGTTAFTVTPNATFAGTVGITGATTLTGGIKDSTGSYTISSPIMSASGVFLVSESASATHGFMMWSNAGDVTNDTGTEICARSGLVCVDTEYASGTGVAVTCSTDWGSTRFYALCE